MDLPNLKDLAKVIALCRKEGVEEIQIGDVRVKLGDKPQSNYKRKKQMEGVDVDPLSDPEALTEEQLLFYSVTDKPKAEGDTN